jgi:hypothetical protein
MPSAANATRIPPPSAPPQISWSALSFIMALLVQSGGTIWWAASAERRIAALESVTEPLSTGLLARLDERSAAQSTAIDRIERRLDGADQVRP